MTTYKLAAIQYLPFDVVVRILLHLSMSDLLVNVQRVCRGWANCIRASSYLQQRLYFQPLPGDTPIFVNPLLFKKFPSFFLLPNRHEEDPTPVAPLLEFMKDRAEVYLRPGATWRGMLVQQPPQKWFYWKDHHDAGMFTEIHVSHIWDITAHGGLRMSAFYDMIITPLGRHNGLMAYRKIWARASWNYLYPPPNPDEVDAANLRNFECPPLVPILEIETSDLRASDNAGHNDHELSVWELLQFYKFPCPDQGVEQLRVDVWLAKTKEWEDGWDNPENVNRRSLNLYQDPGHMLEGALFL